MKYTIASLLSLAPGAIIFAQGAPDDGTRGGSSLEALMERFISVIIDPLITLLFALALLLFLWGLFRLITELAQGGEGTEGKRHMLWGLIGMIIMFSVGGIINLVSNSVGASGDSSVDISGGFE